MLVRLSCVLALLLCLSLWGCSDSGEVAKDANEAQDLSSEQLEQLEENDAKIDEEESTGGQ